MKLVALVAVTAACATSKTPPPPVSPPALHAPLDSLAFYVGSWQCKGTSFARPGQPEERWDARVEVAPELDGRWLSVVMIGPGDNHTAEHKGYDPEDQRWHHLAVTNTGAWLTMSSPGWDRARMVFTRDGVDDHTRTTFEKRGDRDYAHTVTELAAGGETKVWEKICTKTGT